MKIIMVCTGNICRSPMAEGLMHDKLKAQGIHHITVDSAGIEDYHHGQAPDYRAISVMKKHGHDISQLKARQLNHHDVMDNDTIIMCATSAHYRATEQLKARHCGVAQITKMRQDGKDVADPYYGDIKDFESVYHQLDDAFNHWINTQ